MGKYFATGFEIGKSHGAADLEVLLDTSEKQNLLRGYYPQLAQSLPFVRQTNTSLTNQNTSLPANGMKWKFDANARTKADGSRGGYLVSDPNTSENANLAFDLRTLSGSEQGNAVKTNCNNGFGATWFISMQSFSATTYGVVGFCHNAKFYKIQYNFSLNEMRLLEENDATSANMGAASTIVDTGSVPVLSADTWYKNEIELTPAGVINYKFNGVLVCTFDTTVAADMDHSEAQYASSIGGFANFFLCLWGGNQECRLDDLVIYSNDPAYTGDTHTGQPPAIKGAGSLNNTTNGANTTMSATGGAANAHAGTTDASDTTGAQASNSGEILEADYPNFATTFPGITEASVKSDCLQTNIFARQLEANATLGLDGKMIDDVAGETVSDSFDVPGTPGYKALNFQYRKIVGDTPTAINKDNIASWRMQLERTS